MNITVEITLAETKDRLAVVMLRSGVPAVAFPLTLEESEAMIKGLSKANGNLRVALAKAQVYGEAMK